MAVLSSFSAAEAQEAAAYRSDRDLVGFGFNWGQPNETTFEPGLDDQYSLEGFYRFQLAGQLALTPDVQLLFNPVLNPDASSTWVFGIRARLAL